MRLTWLAEVLAKAGLSVLPHQGWETRGRDLTAVYGLVAHHTATGPNWKDEAVCDLLIKGRPDLPGPLSQLGLDRKGRYHVVAAGRANHNGFGLWGNSSIGIEAFNDGVGEAWPDVQVEAYIAGSAAICRHLGWTEKNVKGHKETDPDRKVDPRGIDMNQFRASVAALLAPPEEDDMPAKLIRIPDGRIFAVDRSGITAKHVPDAKTLDALIREGFVVDQIQNVSWESAVWLDIPDK